MSGEASYRRGWGRRSLVLVVLELELAAAAAAGSRGAGVQI
jgi:hypothetical protein